MHIVFGLHGLSPDWPTSTVCIGVFDGVHLGHQSVIHKAIENAKSNGRPCVVMTFDRHPISVLRPEECPPLLLPLGQKLAKLEALGVDVAVVAAFDPVFASQSKEQFFECVLRHAFRAEAVVVGHDFAFGKNREGTIDWLQERISTIVVGPKELDGERVSSSKVRHAIAEGRVDVARRLLGSDFALAGIVGKGAQLGTRLGIPTANIMLLERQAVPAHGIYAGHGITEQGTYPAAISVGDRPTIEGAGFAIEAHLMDFDEGELYGRDILISFRERLRHQERFEDVESLKRQMRLDVEAVRQLLG